MSQAPDIVRIAGLSSEGVAVDVHAIDANEIPPPTWLAENMEAFRIRFPGGVVILSGHAPGWRYIERQWLPPVVTRADKIADVNRVTGGTFYGGFFFRGMWFSLSIASQVSIQGAYTLRKTLSVPVRWANIDDTQVIELASDKDIAEFYAAMVEAILRLRAAGVASKEAIGADEAG
jgi:hypothetical protein